MVEQAEAIILDFLADGWIAIRATGQLGYWANSERKRGEDRLLEWQDVCHDSEVF